MTGVNRNNQGAFSTIYVYTIISVLFLLLKILPVLTKNSLSLSSSQLFASIMESMFTAVSSTILAGSKILCTHHLLAI
jgi:hypothetical protein